MSDRVLLTIAFSSACSSPGTLNLSSVCCLAGNLQISMRLRHRLARVFLRAARSPADHLGHEVLESRGRHAMVRFVHKRIGVQSRVNHNSVYEVVHHGSDAIDATKPAVERGGVLDSSCVSFEHQYNRSSPSASGKGMQPNCSSGLHWGYTHAALKPEAMMSYTVQVPGPRSLQFLCFKRQRGTMAL
jgi:hypothetical protein